MRGFLVTALTGPAGGAFAEVPEPQGAHPWADGDRLLIDVHAAGVSFPDLLQTRGQYQHATPPPYVAGGEVAGIVLEAPTGSGFAPGDRVASLTVWGALAERALGIPRYTVKLPDNVGFTAGAALYLNYATAWFTLHRTGFLPGESVVVHGASGGVGTATLQLVKARGGRTIAVVSTADKELIAREAGADEVLRAEDGWPSKVRELTGGHGAQLVVDPVGGDRFTDSLRCLDIGGRVAVVGFAAGEIPSVKLNRLLLRDLSVVGVALDPFVARFPAIAESLASELHQLAAEGQIRPLAGHVLPLADARRALELIDTRQAVGKVVVTVR